MVAAMLLLAFLSVACANSLSIKHWASHSPINKLHIFHLHGTNIALSVTNVHNDVDSTCKGWLHKLKQSVLPRVISLLIARSPCMPASARLIRAVAIPTREALTKDTHRQSTINTNTNKKVMRVSIDVAGDIQLQQQKRADQLTKLGFAVAAMCAAYGIRPGAGSKTIEPGAAAKHGANHNPQPATRFIIDSRGVDIEGEHLPRAALVDELHRQLTSSRFVHLDSAAATGKTSLFTLYSKSHPEVNVIYCKLHRRTSAYKQLRDVGVDQTLASAGLTFKDFQLSRDEMNQFLNFNFTHPDASLADVLRDPMVQTVLANSCMGHLGALSTSVDALLRRFDRMVGLTVADVLPYIFGYEFIQHFDRCFGKVTEISEKLRLLLREANEKGGVKFDETLLDTADVEALQVLVERGVVCLDKDAMLRFSCPLASRFMVNYIYRRVDS